MVAGAPPRARPATGVTPSLRRVPQVADPRSGVTDLVRKYQASRRESRSRPPRPAPHREWSWSELFICISPSVGFVESHMQEVDRTFGRLGVSPGPVSARPVTGIQIPPSSSQDPASSCPSRHRPAGDRWWSALTHLRWVSAQTSISLSSNGAQRDHDVVSELELVRGVVLEVQVWRAVEQLGPVGA